MKKRIFIWLSCFGSFAYSQQNPTPNPATDPTTGLAATQKGQYAWFRGGNGTGNAAGTNNVFGTLWNSPIYTVTNGVNRMKLNGNFTAGGPTVQYNINGYGFGAGINNINTSGYLLLGANGTSITSPALDLFNNKGAFSMLHLNGATASNGYQEFGLRPWMRTGITLTGNRDLSYFGLRAIGADEDITETTIAWSDN